MKTAKRQSHDQRGISRQPFFKKWPIPMRLPLSGTSSLQKEPTESDRPNSQQEFQQTVIAKTFPRFDLTYKPVGPSPKTGQFEVRMKLYYGFSRQVKEKARTAFMDAFEAKAKSVWQDQYKLRLDEPGMKPYRAKLVFAFERVKKSKNANFRINVARRKKGYRSNVNIGAGQVNLDVGDATNRDESTSKAVDFMIQAGDFEQGSAELNPDVREKLDKAVTFLKGLPKSLLVNDEKLHVEYIGRASAEGSKAYNRKLSDQRIDQASEYIDAQVPDFHGFSTGLPEGESNTEVDSKYRRVDVRIDIPGGNTPGEKVFQNTGAHEFGHMIGLDDEYEEQKGKHRFEGDKVWFHDEVKDRLGEDAAAEMRIADSNSIMSGGMEVRKHHYITLAFLLEKVTQKRWTIE